MIAAERHALSTERHTRTTPADVDDTKHEYFQNDTSDERLNLSDPAVNVGMELMDIVHLPSKLKNFKYDVHTISDLFDSTIKKSDSLRTIAIGRPKGTSLMLAVSNSLGYQALTLRPRTSSKSSCSKSSVRKPTQGFAWGPPQHAP